MANGPLCVYETGDGECGDAAPLAVSVMHVERCCGWSLYPACLDHVDDLVTVLRPFFIVSRPYDVFDRCARWWAERRAS